MLSSHNSYCPPDVSPSHCVPTFIVTMIDRTCELNRSRNASDSQLAEWISNVLTCSSNPVGIVLHQRTQLHR